MTFSKIKICLFIFYCTACILLSCKKNAGTDNNTPPDNSVRVTSVNAIINPVYLNINKTKQLSVTVLPANANNKKITWSSGNTAIATVDTEGAVKGVSAGTTMITAESNDNKTIKTIITLTVLQQYDLYIAGNGTEPNGNLLGPIDYYGCYWKNGIITKLPGGFDVGRSARAITVDGNDVYTVGQVASGTFWFVPALWKNGTPTILASMSTNYHHWATGVTVLGGNSYVSSYIYNNATGSGSYTGILYKVTGSNINQVSLPFSNGMNQSEAHAVTNNGTDIFTSGSIQNNFYSLACYWKNSSSPVILSGLTNYAKGRAIATIGNDVYVAGFEGCPNYGCTIFFKLWKNNASNVVVLGSTNNSTMDITAIAISGNDIYITGHATNTNGKYIATVWKVNGTNVTPIPLSDGTIDTYATGIAVSGKDVFVVGYQHYPGSFGSSVLFPIARYWRLYETDLADSFEIRENSNYQLPNNNGTSRAYAVVIK